MQQCWNALSTFVDGITPVLFKYLSHNKAFYFKASSTYFLLGPGIEHLFLRCFLSPNGKERTDCIPLRFGPSLQKRRLLVLHSVKGSNETVFFPLWFPQHAPVSIVFRQFVNYIFALTSRETLWLLVLSTFSFVILLSQVQTLRWLLCLVENSEKPQQTSMGTNTKNMGQPILTDL